MKPPLENRLTRKVKRAAPTWWTEGEAIADQFYVELFQQEPELFRRVAGLGYGGQMLWTREKADELSSVGLMKCLEAGMDPDSQQGSAAIRALCMGFQIRLTAKVLYPAG